MMLPSFCRYPDLEIRWQQGTSAGEVLAAALPHSFVYKAFNTIGAEHMAAADGSRIFADPAASGPLTMLFAGADNADHRSTVEAIVEGVGFSPRYLGPIRYARNLEAIAELYIHLGESRCSCIYIIPLRTHFLVE
jgi:8-hydroxy-5-deazaflavin:NADPH oxidoreductase